MNYLAHALSSLDDPYFAAGTAVPDWLAVVDRRVRLRAKRVEGFQRDADPATAAMARGVRQHLRDDAQFHAGRAFAELAWELTVAARKTLPEECGLRPNFLGHLLVEVLLDAALAAEDISRVERYYQVLGEVDPPRVEAVVNRIGRRSTRLLAPFIPLFLAERILGDYLEDGKLMKRLNQVMRRVNLPPLPESFVRVLPEARRRVTERKDELLENLTVHPGRIS
jgi:hypothetical protein